MRWTALGTPRLFAEACLCDCREIRRANKCGQFCVCCETKKKKRVYNRLLLLFTKRVEFGFPFINLACAVSLAKGCMFGESSLLLLLAAQPCPPAPQVEERKMWRTDFLQRGIRACAWGLGSTLFISAERTHRARACQQKQHATRH